MFRSIRKVVREQIEYRDLVYRMASFEVKGMYQSHYLGSFWQFLNPAIQLPSITLFLV